MRVKEWLFCIDSDGCAMNTMEIKHRLCFGPCLVNEWQLSDWKKEILNLWNQMNLYSKTRGIHRFQGLAMALGEINIKYCEIKDLDKFIKWVKTSEELSEPALEKECRDGGGECSKKALSWSKEVNRRIEALAQNMKEPFEGVRDALAIANYYGNVAVVSSANRQAVEEEWKHYGLLEYVDALFSQEDGSKAHCIEKLLKNGYFKNHVIMLGDAPSDMKAADNTGVLFYPILAKKETECWKRFEREGIHKFLDETYEGRYEEEMRKAFEENLE